MPRNPRDRSDANRRVVHVTNRCWKGLPFSCNLFIRQTIDAVLAEAQTRYQIEIICYLFMGNHYHMILAGGGKRVSQFMNYVDGEIAKRMIRIYGDIWGKGFWEGRYHEQKLCSLDDVLNKIAYIFSNPVKAGLVHSAEEYPGANSIKALSAPEFTTEKLVPFTYPSQFKPLKSLRNSARTWLNLCKEHIAKVKHYPALKTKLFGWEGCFQERRSRAECLSKIRGLMKLAEDQMAGQRVMGPKRLMNSVINLNYRPIKKKGSKTPFIEACDPEIRRHEISRYRQFKELCRTAWDNFIKGVEAVWPYGAYLPSHYRMAKLSFSSAYG